VLIRDLPQYIRRGIDPFGGEGVGGEGEAHRIAKESSRANHRTSSASVELGSRVGFVAWAAHQLGYTLNANPIGGR